MRPPIPSFARSFRTLAVAVLVLLVGGATAGNAADSFLESDDYKEGEEIVNVFLQEEDYRIMADDFERRGQSFDWGWALTPQWERQAGADAEQDGGGEEKKGLLGRFRGRGGPKLENEPKELAFDVTSYRTVRIPEVENFAGIVSPEELGGIRDAFVLAMEQLGLEVVGGGQGADLELAAAVVDVNREGGGFGWIQVEPFIELELRLQEVAGERNLLLIRNQEHADTPERSALEFANQLVLFLR